MSKEIFENLYKDINGYSLSWKAKDKMLEEETKILYMGKLVMIPCVKYMIFQRLKVI